MVCGKGDLMDRQTVESRLMKQFVVILAGLFCWTLIILLVVSK